MELELAKTNELFTQARQEWNMPTCHKLSALSMDLIQHFDFHPWIQGFLANTILSLRPGSMHARFKSGGRKCPHLHLLVDQDDMAQLPISMPLNQAGLAPTGVLHVLPQKYRTDILRKKSRFLELSESSRGMRVASLISPHDHGWHINKSPVLFQGGFPASQADHHQDHNTDRSSRDKFSYCTNWPC